MSKGWQNQSSYPESLAYTCGHCELMVSSAMGFWRSDNSPPKAGGASVRICPNCDRPTYFEGTDQMPGAPFGATVGNLPESVASIYSEARNCLKVCAYTAGTLALRKMLMNVAVDCGAPENQSFQSYVNYLQANGYVPPRAHSWVDHIRLKSNEATHQIPAITRADAEELVTFAEMVLKLTYDYPERLKARGK